MTKIALVSHGCAKNLIDSELMLGMLNDNGYEITLNENEADIVIVNTCSFIFDAEKESIQSILQLVSAGKKVVVAGCLPQKHKLELKQAIEEISAMIGTSEIGKIVEIVKQVEASDAFVSKIAEKPDYNYPENVRRQQITVGSSSYLKIAEGCNFECGYCVIPKLRGKYHSRKVEDIVEEAKELGNKGVSEIVLIAQDTTSYGIDIYGEKKLPYLLEQLNEIDSISWIRIMYTYPSMIDDKLIKAIKELDKVVKYIDIPLQHSSSKILENMKRPKENPKFLIEKLRKEIPNIAIRTTFIVGYPTETEEDFEHLCNFVKEMKFDKLGVFEFSKEKNTYAYSLKNQVKASVKKRRRKELMNLQREISYEINKNLVGKRISSIIEAIDQNGLIVARTYRDAPEVDGVVYIRTEKKLFPSDIVEVKITNASEYDLFGVV